MNTSDSSIIGEGSKASEVATSIVPLAPSSLSSRIVSGSIGSIITSLVVTPLDVVKVRVQAGQASSTGSIMPCPRGCGTFVLNNGQMECVLPKSVASFFDASTGRLTEQAKAIYASACRPSTLSSREPGTFTLLRTIFRAEGFGGIYAGLRPTLVMAVPNTVLYFSAYEELVWRLRGATTNDPSTNWIPLVAGGTARLLTSCVIAPFEYLRTRLASMVGSNQVSPGMIAEFRTLVQNDGFGSLYQGLRPTLWRDIPFSAIYWMSIERMRTMWRINETVPASPSVQGMQAFINGAVSGMIAAACTTPFDVVKTRQQQVESVQRIEPHRVASLACSHGGAVAYEMDAAALRSASTFQYLRFIAHTEGVRGLWRGNNARMLKVAPACAIMISTYEVGKRLLE